MDSLWRLAWALPLVLAVGLVCVVLMRKMMLMRARLATPVPRMRLCESLDLPTEGRLCLVEVDGQHFLIADSTRQAAIQPLATQSNARAPLVPSLALFRRGRSGVRV